MTEKDEKETENAEEATDYRPHLVGSTVQQWRTRIIVIVLFLAFFIYILYNYGPTLIPPGQQ